MIFRTQPYDKFNFSDMWRISAEHELRWTAVTRDNDVYFKFKNQSDAIAFKMVFPDAEIVDV